MKQLSTKLKRLFAEEPVENISFDKELRKRTTFKWKNSIVRKKDHAVLHISKVKGDERHYYRVKIDLEDVEATNRHKWRIDSKGYAAAWEYDEGECTFTFLHRYILDPKPDEFVDHVNGDILDNRKSNLSICSTMRCIMANCVHANRGVNCRGHYVGIEVNGKWHTVARGDNWLEAKKKAKQIRSGTIDPLEMIIDYRTNGKHLKPTHHIGRVKHGNGFYVKWFGKYIGYTPDFAEAVKMRNAAIRKWAEELLGK